MKRPLSISRNSLPYPDDAPHKTDPVFELDEDRANEKGQEQDENDNSEESSSELPTPGPATPVLDGLSSPPKDDLANRVLSVSPKDGPKSDLGYNPTPIHTRVTHTRNTSRSAPATPTHLDDASVGVPHSASSDKSSHGSKLWNKFARSGSSRGKKLNAALDKTGTLARVVSAGFSSKSHKS